jgi:hypothetical protein
MGLHWYSMPLRALCRWMCWFLCGISVCVLNWTCRWGVGWIGGHKTDRVFIWRNCATSCWCCLYGSYSVRLPSWVLKSFLMKYLPFSPCASQPL